MKSSFNVMKTSISLKSWTMMHLDKKSTNLCITLLKRKRLKKMWQLKMMTTTAWEILRTESLWRESRKLKMDILHPKRAARLICIKKISKMFVGVKRKQRSKAWEAKTKRIQWNSPRPMSLRYAWVKEIALRCMWARTVNDFCYIRIISNIFMS